MQYHYPAMYRDRNLYDGDFSSIILYRDFMNPRSCLVVKTSSYDNSFYKYDHEARILKLLQSFHVVEMLASFSSGCRNYIVMPRYRGNIVEVANQGTTPVTPKLKQTWVDQVATALEFVHRKGYVHGSVSAENCLVKADDSVVLCDFGYATRWDTSIDYAIGVPSSMPPEVVELAYDPSARLTVLPSIDVWALGILWFYLTFWTLPWECADVTTSPEFAEYLLEGDIPLSLPVDWSEHKTMLQMLHPRATQRPSLADVKKQNNQLKL